MQQSAQACRAGYIPLHKELMAVNNQAERLGGNDRFRTNLESPNAVVPARQVRCLAPGGHRRLLQAGLLQVGGGRMHGAVASRGHAFGPGAVQSALALLHLLDVILVVEDLDVAAARLVRHVGQRAHFAARLIFELEFFGLDFNVAAAGLVLDVVLGAHLRLGILEIQLLRLDLLGATPRLVGGVLQRANSALGVPLEFGAQDFLLAAARLVGVVFGGDARRRLGEVDFVALDFHPSAAWFVVGVLQRADFGAHHLQIRGGRLTHLDFVHGQFFALVVFGGETSRAGRVGL